VLIVGLTGGIGAGKSTAARRFGELGATVIDVDALGHVVLEPGGRAFDGVVAEFGPGVLDDDGRIRRPTLAGIVFRDPDALTRLTAVSHPAINAELVERLAALASDAPDGVVVLDMAILVESDLGRSNPVHRYQVVVTVEAPLEVRVARAVARGAAAPDVRRRIEAQASEAERRAAADLVLVNGGTEADLVRQVDAAWAVLLTRHPT